MRRIPALVSSVAVAALAAVALTGCSVSADGTCAPLLAAGDSSALISASGDVGTAEPKVSFPTGLQVSHAERSVLERGTGAVAQNGAVVDIEAVLLDGTSGQVMDATAFDATDATSFLVRAGGEGAMAAALQCARAGDRIAVTSPLAESGVSVNATDESVLKSAVVLVLDIQGVYLGKADGLNQLPQDGMPSVVTAVDGTPGIQVPKAAAPEATRTATIKAGSGTAVADGDTVVLHLAYWAWPAEGMPAANLYSSWNGTAQALPVTLDPTGQTGIPKGVYDALVGATVGSQVLVAVAPQDSFADGAWPTGTTANDTLIYVIDVLGIFGESAE